MGISVHSNHVLFVGKITFPEWANAVRDAKREQDNLNWVIGDLLNYGKAAFKEKFWQVFDDLNWNRHTAENRMWVASAFPKNRRRHNVSWSHHQTVAKMKEADQENWLDRAVEKSLSVDDLREAVRKKKDEPEVHVDRRFASEWKAWVKDTETRLDLLKAITHGKLDVVGFDKAKRMPLVRKRDKAAA